MKTLFSKWQIALITCIFFSNTWSELVQNEVCKWQKKLSHVDGKWLHVLDVCLRLLLRDVFYGNVDVMASRVLPFCYDKEIRLINLTLCKKHLL